MKRVALFSLDDTSRAEEFAAQLVKAGWDIVASRETFDLLNSKSLPVQDVSDYIGVKEDYGFPPTLHAKIEYALTDSGSQQIDLVYVIPYPLSKGNDVGGRTLLALAVKGGRTAVMSIADMEKVMSVISVAGDIPVELRLELAEKVCVETAKHYSSLAVGRGTYDLISGRFSGALMNGENPYQVPATVFITEHEDDPLSIRNMKQISGEAPCFTNMADADCILNTLCQAAEAFVLNTGALPYLCVAAKHGNACGMGVSRKSPAQAVEKALFGNPRSVWGGEVITNFPIDKELSEILFKSECRNRLFGDGSWMLDLVMAPSFSAEAITVLGKRKDRKLFENANLSTPLLKKTGFSYRMVRGGFLRQPHANYVLNLKEAWNGDKCFSEDQISSLIVSWAVAFNSSHGGNEVALAKEGVLLSAGGGPSTIEAARVAVARAIECGHDLQGGTFAADAFFPFTDAPALLCDAGITSGCVPSGGKCENEVRTCFQEHNASVVYLPPEIRGFCRH